MAANPDFRDLIFELNAAGVEFLLVGDHALAAHGVIRFTKDMDLWIRPSSANADRAWTALERFGAPMSRLQKEDFARPAMVVQIGLAPNRIDLLTRVDGLEFAEAWEGRIHSQYGDQEVQVLGRNDLIRNKRAAGRPQDLLDADTLERNSP